jgi:hypothetical protein
VAREFDWVYREMDYATYCLTIHPDVSGRPQVLLMLERVIEYINGHDGVRWVTMEEIAEDFVQRYPRSEPNHDPGINMYGIETSAADGASGGQHATAGQQTTGEQSSSLGTTGS